MGEDLAFGASISTSGRYALQGRQALAGVRAWAAATNAEGGAKVPGSGRTARVRLIHYDDGSSSARAVANVTKLIGADKVHILLGPYSSDLTAAVVPVTRRGGKVLWNHGGAVDAIHRPGGRVVGILTPASRYFSGIVGLARAIDPHARRIAFLHRRGSRFGALAARGTGRAVRVGRLTFTILSYPSAKDDLSACLARLRQFEADVILSAGSFQDEHLLARRLLAGKLGAKAFGFVAAGIRQFAKALGRAAEGVLGPSQWEPGPGSTVDVGPGSHTAAKRIRAVGVSPDYPAAQAYAACVIAQHCLQEARSFDDEALWEAACRLDCTTFFGRFKVDPRTGIQVGHEMVWVQWRHGRKAVVWPPGAARVKPIQLTISLR